MTMGDGRARSPRKDRGHAIPFQGIPSLDADLLLAIHAEHTTAEQERRASIQIKKITEQMREREDRRANEPEQMTPFKLAAIMAALNPNEY